MHVTTHEREVLLELEHVELPGTLALPAGAHAIVVFAHGSGSSRLSPRNTAVARVLQERGFATLLFDLLTPTEDAVYERRFDIDLLAERLVAATGWLAALDETSGMRVGYFGASTGAAAALVAAAEVGDAVGAVVSRGGRPDLGGQALPEVTAPTLLIVGGADQMVLGLNREAAARMRTHTEIAVVPGATHLFEEPGALEEVTELATGWFERYLAGEGRRPSG